MTTWSQLKTVRGTSALNDWTPEREETARKMWFDGHSASQIAKALNCGLSKNAVVGKIHRRGWKKRDVVLSPYANTGRIAGERKQLIRRAGPEPMTITRGKPKPGRPIKEVAASAPLVPMEKLTGQMCRWPFGDPQDPAFGFCGCHKTADVPYCADHMRKAYSHVPKAKPERSHAETERKLREMKRWAA